MFYGKYELFCILKFLCSETEDERNKFCVVII